MEVAYIHQLPLPSTGNEKEQTYWLEIQQQKSMHTVLPKCDKDQYLKNLQEGRQGWG